MEWGRHSQLNDAELAFGLVGLFVCLFVRIGLVPLEAKENSSVLLSEAGGWGGEGRCPFFKGLRPWH